MARMILIALLGWAGLSGATDLRSFDDPEKQAHYEHLIEELRCLVCQNQSLADSDADLARDLRNEVYDIIQSGKSEDEAIRFLTDRYGDFVLYRPPVKPITWLLWGGPLLILIAGVALLLRQIRHRNTPAETDISEDERKRLEHLKQSLTRKPDASTRRRPPSSHASKRNRP